LSCLVGEPSKARKKAQLRIPGEKTKKVHIGTLKFQTKNGKWEKQILLSFFFYFLKNYKTQSREYQYIVTIQDSGSE
jgi:carboxypeptidase C (cathepsin A)